MRDDSEQWWVSKNRDGYAVSNHPPRKEDDFIAVFYDRKLAFEEMHQCEQEKYRRDTRIEYVWVGIGLLIVVAIVLLLDFK